MEDGCAYKRSHFSGEGPEKKPPEGRSLPDLIPRLQPCTYTLRVFEDADFVLQRVPLVLQTVVDDNELRME